jgi:hypothetical protein
MQRAGNGDMILVESETTMTNLRDMSKRQFDEACKRYNFIPEGFMGYYKLPSGVNVSILNAGDNRRAQLAYLIQEWHKDQDRKASGK